MRDILYKILLPIRRLIWSFIVAYMLGLHNFYKGEDKNVDDILKTENTVERDEVQEKGTSKD